MDAPRPAIRFSAVIVKIRALGNHFVAISVLTADPYHLTLYKSFFPKNGNKIKNIGKYSGRFSGLLGPPWAPGWPETDSPRKMMASSGVETKIGALGNRFVAIFRFWKTFGAQTTPLANPPLTLPDIPSIFIQGGCKNNDLFQKMFWVFV